MRATTSSREEITLTGRSARLDWATGAFYYTRDDSDRGYDVLYPCTAQNPFVCIHEQDQYVRQTTENWAVFAHGMYQFTDAFSFTGGGALHVGPEERDDL